MNYFLGVDAGGTKTKAVIIDENSAIMAETMSGPANYHNVGLELTSKNVFQAVEQAVKTAKLNLTDVVWCTIGIAACDTDSDHKRLITTFSSNELKSFVNKMTVVNDTKIGLYCGTTPPGIVVVCGTGCNVYGKNAFGVGAMAGNWGHFLGDKGSGYHLGKRMFEMVVEAYDGRGEATLLTEKLASRLKISGPKEILDWYNDHQPTVHEVSDFAPLVIEAAEANDEVAKQLLDISVSELGRALIAVVKRLKMQDEALRIVIVGGLFESKYFRALFEGHVTALFKHVRLIKPLVPAAVGAAIMAKSEWEKQHKLT